MFVGTYCLRLPSSGLISTFSQRRSHASIIARQSLFHRKEGFSFRSFSHVFSLTISNRRVSSCALPMSSSSESDPLIQYVVIRRDLITSSEFEWPLGSIVSQGVHAAVAAINAFRIHSRTAQEYCAQFHGVSIYESGSLRNVQPTSRDTSIEDLTQMRTVTLEVKNESALLKLVEKLNASQIEFVVWNEMPENLPTALATKPMPKSIIFPLLKNLRLMK
mmetsp:Transcript_13584/g.24359  ORF Transcript_13584/g.24359 Transcript_13584/m.24359 type:complete len:219 (+) Transcript_13584:45-701(+)